MELKHVIPNMEKTFGQLEYAGKGKLNNAVSMVDLLFSHVATIYIRPFNEQMIL